MAKADNKTQQHQSNAEDDKYKRLQEKYKKEHEDWCVNGVYYGTEEEYQKAKEKYDKEVAAAEEAAKAEAERKKAEAARITSEVNKAIYGENSDISIADMTETLGGVEMKAILGNSEDVAKRQHILDPTNYISELKKPNNGKMPHNEDPFPVDLKIEEFEAHKPDVKIHSITCNVKAEPAAKAAMIVSDTAEKRLIHLENNIATLMRYVFRMGARMNINCVYWGGTTPFQKYKTIRCLNHDLVSEGQNIQIDQCLCCTRFEPIIGQCYEIMNDLGANVAAIMDDNQMAYCNMDDYVKLSRIEKFIEKKDAAKFDLGLVLSRNIKTDPEFKSGGLVPWGKGLAMQWKPVAKEEQRCHINWRQSINDDGSSLGRLDTFPVDEKFGTNVTGANGGGNMKNGGNSKMKANKDAMDKATEPYKQWVNIGTSAAQNPDPIASEYCMKDNQIWPKIMETCKGTGIDTLLTACIMAMQNKHQPTDACTVVEAYKKLKGEVGDNPATICAAMVYGVEAINGKGDFSSVKPVSTSDSGGSSKITLAALKAAGVIPPIEKYGEGLIEHDKSSSNSSDDKKDTTSTYPKIDRNNIDNWLWTDFALALSDNASLLGKDISDVAFFCKIVYMYFAIAPLIRNSSFDGDEYAFPFTDEECDECDGIQFSGLFGEQRSTHIHRGIDLATGEGHNPPIHAIKSGTCIDAGDTWDPDMNAIIIDHGDGTYARYLHCSQISVSKGASVNKGDIVGYVGGMGASGANTYPNHLHLEVGHGTGACEQSDTDPISLFNCNGIQHNQMFRSTGIS